MSFTADEMSAYRASARKRQQQKSEEMLINIIVTMYVNLTSLRYKTQVMRLTVGCDRISMSSARIIVI